MRVSLCLIGCLISIGAGNGLFAHSLDEVKQVLPDQQEAIPQDILEMTRILDKRNGARSVRDETHERQHRRLLDHVRRHTKQKCADLIDNLPALDQDIARMQDHGPSIEEQMLREIRDIAHAFVTVNCPATENRQ